MAVHDLRTAAVPEVQVSAAVCIIGAGVAGLLIADRLAKAGIKSIIVESGTDGFDEAIHDLNTLESTADRYTRAKTGRYRGLGGSSTRWGGRMVPISRHELSERDYLNIPGWPVPADELEAHTPEIEKLFGLDGGSYESDVLAELDLAGYLPLDDPDFTCRWPKWINFRSCNVAAVLRRDRQAWANLEIWTGATVCDFELDRERGALSGIIARNFGANRLTVRADRFIIAAGTIETTRLLLWLNECAQHHAFGHDHVIGHYFQDHLKAKVGSIARTDLTLSNRLFGYHFIAGTRRSMHIELTPAAQRSEAVGSAFAFAAMDMSQSALAKVKTLLRGVQSGEARPRDVAETLREVSLITRAAHWRYFKRQLFMPPEVGIDLQLCVEQLPDTDNRVKLASSCDKLGVPKVFLDWRPREAEERSFQAAMRRLRAYWQRTGLDKLCPILWGEAWGDPQVHIADFAEPYAHPSGSTRMGTDPWSSVVDAQLRCHRVPNVSIASAAVFPTAGSANPTFTIMKLALRLADSLVAQTRAVVGQSGRSPDVANAALFERQ